VLVVVDQIIKVLTLKNIADVATVPIIQDFFHLTFAPNTGASFGIFQGKTLILGIVSLVTSLVLIIYLIKQIKAHPEKKLFLCSLSLIIAGALGNMVDRLFRGYVVDMFEFRFINFAIFNFADSLISIGAVIFCGYLIFDKEMFGEGKDGVKQKER
jgi:signal peptidase II